MSRPGSCVLYHPCAARSGLPARRAGEHMPRSPSASSRCRRKRRRSPGRTRVPSRQTLGPARAAVASGHGGLREILPAREPLAQALDKRLGAQAERASELPPWAGLASPIMAELPVKQVVMQHQSGDSWAPGAAPSSGRCTCIGRMTHAAPVAARAVLSRRRPTSSGSAPTRHRIGGAVRRHFRPSRCQPWSIGRCYARRDI
jgi:hypothetical protein